MILIFLIYSMFFPVQPCNCVTAVRFPSIYAGLRGYRFVTLRCNCRQLKRQFIVLCDLFKAVILRHLYPYTADCLAKKLFIFGILPARQAANKNLIDILR